MLHVGSGSGASRRNVGACRIALAGVAAALLGWSGEPVRAQGVPPPNCSVSPLDGSVVNCTGDLSSGVVLDDGAGPFRALNVFDLTTDIDPPGSSGIVFTSDGNVTLNVDAGPFRIVTTADDAIGVFGGSLNGNVSITSRADITTFGDFAPGIAAIADGDVAVVSRGDITTFGDVPPGIAVIADGDAAVVSTGNITTTGDASDGIQVMSGFGTALAVSFGNVSATGLGSAGIYASGDSDAIVMNFGSVVGGPCCAGVMMDANGLNTLLNWGTITAGLADFAIDLMASDNVVENFGTVTGNVILSDGFGPEGTFINHAGAVFNAGAIVAVGTMTNAGTLAPGGVGALETTFLENELVQTGTGVLAIDIDGAAGTSDEIIVSDTAVLAGTVAVNVTSLPPTGPQQFTILQALSGVTNNGLLLLASPALHAALSFTATDVVLSTSIDFSAISALNGNQRAIGSSLHQAFTLGGGGLAPILLGLLNTPGLDAYKDALDQLSPEIMSDVQISALYASLGFANSLFSCKVNGTTTASIIREGQCLWAGASAVFLDSGTTSQQIGFNQTTGLFAAGAQVALDNVWRLGLGVGYESSAIDTATNATSESEMGQAGLALKYNPGPFLMAGVVNGGRAWSDTIRPMSFGGFTAIARSDTTIDVLNGGVRVAYVLGAPQLYVKPVVDAAATRLDLHGFTETGGGAANLAVAGSNQTVYTVAPSLEVGTEWWLANGTLIRPYLRGGVAWYEGGDFALTAGFLGAPVGIAPFTITTGMDDVMGTIAAGLDVITGEDSVLHVSYDGQLGETTQIHAVGLKGSARF